MELKKIKSQEIIFRESLIKSGICKKLLKDLKDKKMFLRNGILTTEVVNTSLMKFPTSVAYEFCSFAQGSKRGFREYFVGIEKINNESFRYYAKSFEGDLLAERRCRCGNQADLIESFQFEKRFFFSDDISIKAAGGFTDSEILNWNLSCVITEPVKLVTKLFQKLKKGGN